MFVLHLNDPWLSCNSDRAEANGNGTYVSTSRQQLYVLLVIDCRLSVNILVKFHSGLSLLSASQCLRAIAHVLVCECAIFAGRLQLNVKRSILSGFTYPVLAWWQLSRCVHLQWFMLEERLADGAETLSYKIKSRGLNLSSSWRKWVWCCIRAITFV